MPKKTNDIYQKSTAKASHSPSKMPEPPTLQEVQASWWWRNESLIPLGLLDVEGRQANKQRVPNTIRPFKFEKWAAIAYETCARWSGEGKTFYWPPRYPLNYPWIHLDPLLRCTICEGIWPTVMGGAQAVPQPTLSFLQSFLLRRGVAGSNRALRTVVEIDLGQSNNTIVRDIERVVADSRKSLGLENPASKDKKNNLNYSGLEALSKKAAGIPITRREYFDVIRQKFSFGSHVQLGWEIFSDPRFPTPRIPFHGFLGDSSPRHSEACPRPRQLFPIIAGNDSEVRSQLMLRLIGLRLRRESVIDYIDWRKKYDFYSQGLSCGSQK